VSETGLPAHQPLYAQTYQKSNGNINETDPSLQQNNWQESVHEDSRHQHSSFFSLRAAENRKQVGAVAANGVGLPKRELGVRTPIESSEFFKLFL